ncbi:MAG: 4Fe-4S single cluster domain-containing protein [Bacillota bacterium]|jgi:anaerobic ribonucleoside-triphosphate reductase activating protein
MVRLAGIAHNSLSNGPGTRLVVFFQGCPHRCPGCQNPETWDAAGGQETPLLDIAQYLLENRPVITGVTLSGGEPFAQARSAAIVALLAREIGLDVWTYTGYEYEALLEMAEGDPWVKLLLEQTDTLVDGPFLQERTDNPLPYTGSNNQRVIRLRE